MDKYNHSHDEHDGPEYINVPFRPQDVGMLTVMAEMSIIVARATLPPDELHQFKEMGLEFLKRVQESVVQGKNEWDKNKAIDGLKIKFQEPPTEDKK